MVNFTVETHPELFTTPDDARRNLEEFGINPDRWNVIMKRRDIGIHYIQALIRIARGSEPRMPGEVYEEIRREQGLNGIRNLRLER